MSSMKFLVDECLSHRLCGVARARGIEAMHLRDLDLLGSPDWELLNRIQTEDWTFVTNNARDFLKLYAKLNLHAGLLIVVPNVPVKQQRHLFRTALRKLGPKPDLVNKLVYVELDASITISELP